MKTLSQILVSIEPCEVLGSTEREVSALVFDSRKVAEKGDGVVYVAQRGTQTDGHLYIPQAVAAGARVVVCEELPATCAPEVTYVRVEKADVALGRMAAELYDHPSRKLKLVGITGTNGKTTTVTLLHRLFSELGYGTGLISTIVNKIREREIPATHTTPDVVTLNELLSEMVREGCEYCFMEVSSHAICQHRIEGLEFAGGIFSNITHDHLAFDGTARRNPREGRRYLFDRRLRRTPGHP